MGIRIRLIIITFFLACGALRVDAQTSANQLVLKVSVLQSNVVLLNGTPTSLEILNSAFANAAQNQGVVWYYRESADAEPPPVGMKVVELIVKHSLPVSFSTNPDFSYAVDPDGVSRPREKPSNQPLHPTPTAAEPPRRG